MINQVFINLPVKDIKRSVEFFKALGFSFNAQFTSDNAACLIISENVFSMLLTHEMFKSFAPGGICDTAKENEALISISLESREKVDDMIKKAVKTGGRAHGEAEDKGFMYDHGFLDLDGHAWGTFYMDPAHFQK